MAAVSSEQAVKHTKILDLSCATDLDESFLHQYLTLTRADLFFADKAILVEGTTERLIVPAAIKMSEPGLNEQYITLIEVGGAYAYKFFPLLDFLEIPTLIITDIDAVASQKNQTRKKASTVHKGDGTSNATIKNWFTKSSQTPLELLKAAEGKEIIRNGRYLAYQIAEEGQAACGRTFEDAFILANPELFEFTSTGNVDEDEDLARTMAQEQKKSTFALHYAIEEKGWKTPKYIARGLTWLLKYPISSDSYREVANAENLEAVVK